MKKWDLLKIRSALLSRQHKIFKIMRLSIIFIFFFQFNLSATLLSQHMKVSLDLKDVNMKEFLRAVKKETNLSFLYSAGLIESAGKITLQVKDRELDQVLREVLVTRGLTYTYKDEVVIITKLSEMDQLRDNLINIRGRVTDESMQPLPGVTVHLKGSALGTSTDVNGRYSLSVPKAERFSLVFSFIGMEAKEVRYTGKDTIDVVMKESAAQLKEVIVSTGYEQIDLRKTTSSIQSIRAEDIVVPGLTTIDQMLEGYTPGMIFIQNSGQVGTTPRLRIRGTSTVLGSREPVWVIDGIVQENPVDISPEQINDLDFVNLLGNAITGLNPEDVEQIDILKDASATALYGARAANGVIVITTKQGKQGPPSLSYSLSGTFTKRPHYSDAAVNMMNSVERIDFSRELMEKRVPYPQVSTWLGYEKQIRDYWLGDITFEEMQTEIGKYEAVNTDWFDILMQNTFSHKHTLNLSGGSSALRYYISVGLTNIPGNIRGEEYRQYTANINISANYKRLSVRFGLNGNVGDKKYVPSDIEVTKYAYETTRALPAYNDDGTLWYYGRDIYSGYYRDFNIINETKNSSQEIRSSGITATASLNYKISESFNASLTASYSTNNTTQETWHGASTFYAAKLRLPMISSTPDRDGLPYGDELKYQDTERYAYTARAQLNFRSFADDEEKHLFSASAGGEVSSNHYYGLSKTFRGYLRDRGQKMAEVNPIDHPFFAKWLATDSQALGVWTNKLTNILSGYATASYTYNNLYTVNVNVRVDASNRFGSRANEKLAPIWSFSARWNIKDDIFSQQSWINDLALRGSFGYQGNMLESQSAKLVIARQGIDSDFKEYESTIASYPNNDLKWEKTSSYNASLNFSLFRNRISGELSYFYKHTKNAFLNKSISSINGLKNWVVNQGTLSNQGLELSLRFTVIDTRRHNPNGVTWSMAPNFGQILNKVGGKSKDKSLTNEITYTNYLNGTAEIPGRPLNSFYSYQFYGLDATNGLPIFYGSNQQQYIGDNKVDLLEKYTKMTPAEVFADVMTYSGTRVPKVQGGIQNSVSWRRFSASINMTYSFGSKVRLLKLYSDVISNYNTIAPQPTANVRKEFLKRWQQPGDELHTSIPGIVSSTEFTNTLYGKMWWCFETNNDGESIVFANNLWEMYDNSDQRTVSGNYLKIQSLSVRYNIPDKICQSLNIQSAHVGISGTNIHTFCHRRLRGQDPATQSGTAPTINLSLRPTYSFNLNVSF